ncbi:SWIM zinc finger family protein [Fictibacillus sp. KIGAM418]|uniref:SWIM zinc finger family protein n=1 Tax=Fictibacillus marinisediminis TaxID=2878389 RepID=A0A9X1XA28_9BACL|nr:SWIM zinc finger family protein [Fictibacillus marinisediminis]MCK6255995.1 SWIM zinc finger family protein [Fictibacillus marinisediminis]
MLSKQIPKDVVLELGKDVLFHFSGEVIQEGYALYQKGAVYNINVDNKTVTGSVSEESEYAVSLDLEHISESSCSCVSSEPCAHKLAVFFQLYASFGPPYQLILEWKSKRGKLKNEQQEAMISSADQRESSTKNAEPKTRKRVIQNILSVDEWKKNFNQRFEDFEKNKMQNLTFKELEKGEGYTFTHIHKEFYPGLLNAASFMDDDIGKLYRFHAQLETFLRLTEYEKQYGVPDYLASHFKLNLSQLVDGMFKTAMEIQAERLKAEHLDLIEESLKEFQNIFKLPARYFDIIFRVFQVGWATIYHVDQWVVAYEKQLLEEKEKGSRAQFLDMALVHFAFLRDDLTEAYQRMEKTEQFSSRHALIWLELLFHWEKWESLLKWLLALKPEFYRKTQDYYRDTSVREQFHQYIEYFWKYAQYTGEEMEYEQMLVDCLPVTFYEYNEFLHVQQDFKRWVELQILMGYSPSLINGTDLKEVEQLDMEVLLPLYHQSVDRLIREKNRKSYKLAIRFLKKLQSIYKKLGRDVQFDDYIEKLASQYARLRAFQEELRKGKFIHD